VNQTQASHDKIFKSLAAAFEQYKPGVFTLVQGKATAVKESEKSVVVHANRNLAIMTAAPQRLEVARERIRAACAERNYFSPAFQLATSDSSETFMCPPDPDQVLRDLQTLFEKFQEHFNGAALGLQGSGWAVLGYDHVADRLVIEQMTDQQGNLSINLTPLLLLDMWEHAFYLQYKNVKADYVKAVWNVFNWDEVATRFEAAKK
jgi:superoxide dismutase